MKAECRACKKVWTVKDRFDPNIRHDCPEVDDWEKADTLIVRRVTPPAISFYETPSPALVSSSPPVSLSPAPSLPAPSPPTHSPLASSSPPKAEPLPPADALASFKRDLHWQVIFRHVWQDVSRVAEILAVKEGSIADGSCDESPWLGVFRLQDGRYFVVRGTLHFAGWSGSSLAGKLCYGDLFSSLENAKRLGLALEEYALLFPEEMWTGQ